MGESAGREADQSLVGEFQRGRQPQRRRAFCALYERHAGNLRQYVGRMTRCDDLADDLTQEAFLKALAGLDGFRGNSSFKTWLYQIATNLVVSHRRRKKTMTGGSRCEEAQAATPSPAETLSLREERDRVRVAVEALPEDLRAPLLLVRVEGLKYREAADVLGLTLSAVRMRVHRAHAALTEKLAGAMEQ